MKAMKIKNRLFDPKIPLKTSAFLWGPRQVGKSYWIKNNLPDSILIDLLKTDVFADFVSRPALLRERYSDVTQRIVIDEIQKVPSLLDEVHWLIENKNITFLLIGSSARKLKRSHANMLGGRAWRYTMTPLCYPEIDHFSIEQALISGFLPPHLVSEDPTQALRAYVADYLKEEIAAEAVVQNIPAFAEFLRIAAITSSELLNYSNIAREAGVSHKVIRSYFQILEDTLLGFRLSPWKRSNNRKLVETEKFYLFDVGVANYLARRKPAPGTPEFGKAFEHYLLMEVKAYQAYRDPELPICFWRTKEGTEVDLILGDMEVAIAIKSSRRVHDTDAKALRLLKQSHHLKRALVVSFEPEAKKLSDGIECLPWEIFLEQLWGGELI